MNIQYLQIQRPFSFSSPFRGDEFAALIYVIDANVSNEEQKTLSDQIVASGCRYAVCAGHKCSTWDDSIDMAHVMRNLGNVTEDNLVMTTWHEDEPLEDIVELFLNYTSFGNFVAKRMLVFVIGTNGATLDDIRNEITKQLSCN